MPVLRIAASIPETIKTWEERWNERLERDVDIRARIIMKETCGRYAPRNSPRTPSARKIVERASNEFL
jgi:hypothetical protein